MQTDSIFSYEQFTEQLNRNSFGSFSSEAIFFFALATILVIVAVVLYEIYRTNKVKYELLALAWDKFNFRVESLNLNRGYVDLLKKIAHEAGLQDPSSIVKFPQVFESSLEKYYENKRIESISNEKLERIRDLRKALGFLPLSVDMAFTSTRQFSAGDKCIAQIPASGRATHKGMCIIGGVEEREWSISRLDGPDVPAKSTIFINLTRPGDAEYTFTAQVLKDSNGELILTHVNKLNRAQQRNWVRIDVSVPVEVTQITANGIGDIFSGKIVDMSGGGFGMVLPVKLINGAKLQLDFELPGQGAIKALPVKVVRVAGMINNDPSKILHSVAFDGDVHQIQEQIIQYVFEKQRRDSMIKQG